MKNKTSLLTVFVMIFFSVSQAQVTQEWASVQSSLSDNQYLVSSMAVDNSGNVYVVGSEGLNALSDYITIKYNSSGQQQWIKRYNGPGNTEDYASDIGIDQAGNVYVTGGSFTSSFLNYTTVKYNSGGNEEWAVTQTGGNGYDLLTNNMAVDPSGNVYLTIQTSGGSCTNLKLNSSGQQQWIAYYSAYATSLAIDASGNTYVAGAIFSSASYVTLKYNSTGQRQWDTTYSAPGSVQSVPSQIAVDNSGNVYTTGYSFRSGFLDFATVKYNSSGHQQWAEIYDGPGNGDDNASSIAVDLSGNIYVAGSTSVSTSESDFTVIKYNSAGQQQWIETHGAGYASAIIVDAPGNIYVTGKSLSADSSDYLTLKYNSSGQQQWVATYNGSINRSDYATAIALDASSNVYVTGISSGQVYYEYATLKYSQITGISQISNSNPDKFSLSQNYPNPFNPTTHLEFGISDFGFVSLKVYDVLGNEMKTLVNENKTAGKYSVEFDASNFPSGVYFYKFQAGDFVETRRMTLVK